jgi:hypothetical protein
VAAFVDVRDWVGCSTSMNGQRDPQVGRSWNITGLLNFYERAA